MSKIPDLITRLREIHESQVLEIRGALHGRGGLELSDRAKHIRVTHNLWVDLTDAQRSKFFSKFINFRPRMDFQNSSDGLLTIPATAKLAKKPGQVKRVRQTKTTTMAKRPKVV